MHRFSRLVEELVEAFSVPLYSAAGVLEGDLLLVEGFVEGRQLLFLHDGQSLRGLGVEYFSLARHRYGSRRVAYTVDLGGGAEREAVYLLDPSTGARERLAGLPEARILGLVHTESGLVAAVVSTGEEVALYAARPGGGARRVARLPGPGLLLDADDEYAVGLLLEGFRLFIAELRSGKLRLHSHPGGAVEAAALGGGRVYYSAMEPRGAGVYVLDAVGGEPEPLRVPGLAEYGATEVGWLDVTPDGEVLLAAYRGIRGRLFTSRLGDTGFPGGEGVVGNAYRWRGRLVASYSSIRTPGSVVEAPSGAVVAAGEPPWWLEEAVAGVYDVYPEAPDGSTVPTMVVESGRAPRPGPTVVLIHGGPFEVYRDSWRASIALLAAMGFHVVAPNYRGSLGYGSEWARRIIGDPCGAEVEDVAAAAGWAREGGLASRLYAMGYSYGGFLTLCLLTRRPGFFEGGVAGAPMVDWVEARRLGDAVMRGFIDMLFAGAGEEAMRERSPITHVANLREPVCILASTNDTRTPVQPVLRFIEEAVRLGKSVEAHIAPDMGHAITRAEDAVRALLPGFLFLARLEEQRRRRAPAGG